MAREVLTKEVGEMTETRCIYCGQFYFIEIGHNYDECVKNCQSMVEWCKFGLADAKAALRGAKRREDENKDTY